MFYFACKEIVFKDFQPAKSIIIRTLVILKKSVCQKLFSFFSTKTYVLGTQNNHLNDVVGTQNKRLNETVILSTQNIC